jgi:hypothetical protein
MASSGHIRQQLPHLAQAVMLCKSVRLFLLLAWLSAAAGQFSTHARHPVHLAFTLKLDIF